MLFNSIDFAVFLPVVFVLYWFGVYRNLKLQNLFIVVVSYIFYGWWDWRFLSLILFSSLVDYFVGRGLLNQENQTKRKILLLISIGVNLGFLGFFKYTNFFLDSLTGAFSLFGAGISPSSLNIILPVGISFYTFQTLSYSIDVYKRKIEPTTDIVAFLAYVSFFPQLVAGPIERATNLLPQFYSKRTFDASKAVDGLRQILWGIFKKVVIADNCAVVTNMIFTPTEDFSGSTLVLGAMFFAFQVYGDFSGYSDIAIGTSRLFGFNIKQNFAFPFFSRDIAEFWRRWHISLTTWFRDYLYIPLGGSRGGTLMKVRNTALIFVVSGFWHGANWTYIIWGALNALLFLPLLLSRKNRDHLEIVAQGKILPSVREFFSMLLTFGLFVFTMIFFRAQNMAHVTTILSRVFSPSLFTVPHFTGMHDALMVLTLVALFMVAEWFGREEQYAIQRVGLTWKWPARWALYSFIVFIIGMFMHTEETPFIYFQF